MLQPSSGLPAVEGANNRRLDIQGLRAIAILMVVAFHGGLPVPGGFVGVDVFFVVSGFVITAMLQREWAATGRIRFGAFYIRRFNRLAPALALMVTVTVVIAILVLSPFGAEQTAAKTAIGTMLLAANFVIARTTGGYFNAPAETNPLLNAWSLSVEEQFYLAFPLILTVGWLLARRVRFLKHTPFLFVGVVAVVSFALAVLGSAGYVLPRAWWLIGFYSPFTRAWEFGAGALLALSAATFILTSRRIATTLGLVGFAMLAASLWLISDTTPFPGVCTLLPVIGTLLLLAAGSHDSNIITRALATTPMVRVGDWSYSIYLWHWPLIVFTVLLWPNNPVAPALAALLSLAPSVASFKYVEQPIRSRVPRSRPRLASLVVATVLPPIAFAVMLGLGARAQWWMTWSSESTFGKNEHVASGCNDQPFDPNHCKWGGGEGANGTLLLAGDSQAYAYADGVIMAAARLSMNTVVSSRSGCPLSTIDTTGKKPRDCPSWQRQVLSYALETKPDVVVIANRSAGYTRPESGWRTFIDEHGMAATSSNATTLYEVGLNNVIKMLRAAGIGAVVLQNIPEPDDYNPSILRRLLRTSGPKSFDSTMTIANRSRAADVEAKVASSNPGTILYDPIPVLCASGACPLTKHGARIYSNTMHLTRDGALLLAPSLEDAIRRAANAQLGIAQDPSRSGAGSGEGRK